MFGSRSWQTSEGVDVTLEPDGWHPEFTRGRGVDIVMPLIGYSVALIIANVVMVASMSSSEEDKPARRSIHLNAAETGSEDKVSALVSCFWIPK